MVLIMLKSLVLHSECAASASALREYHVSEVEINVRTR
jgi:hypothetical protein